MQVSMLTAVVSLLVLAMTYAFVWALRRLRSHQFFVAYGIPGPKPELVWGNYMQLKRNKIEVMDEWIKEHGKIFGYYEGEKPILVIADVDLIKECFVKNTQVFQNRPRFTLRCEPFASGLLSLRGEEWKGIRSMLNPCFSASKLKLLMPIVDQCSDTFVKVLDDHVARNKMVHIDVAAQAFSLDVIAKAALAFQVNCQEDPSDPLFRAIRAFFTQGESRAVEYGIAFPVLCFFFCLLYPFTEHGKFADCILDNVRAVINVRKLKDHPLAQDMVQAMLDVRAGQPSSQKQAVLLEDRHVLANSFLFLAAGFDTTASALTFAVYCLAKYSREQEKVYSELLRVVPCSKDFSYDKLKELKYLDAVIKESLRMFPSVILFTSRTCEKDVFIGGLCIPEGTNIVIPTWQLHHDPEHWSDPWDFKPERFLQEEFNPATFLPFGLGPRMCIGKGLALLELKVTLYKMLRKYSVTLSDTVREPLRLTVPTIILNAQDGVHIRLEAREHKIV